MSGGKRVLIASLVAVLSLPVIGWLLSELVVFYELFATGAGSRTELGDDFGFGLLLFFVVPPGTIVGAAVVWLTVWSGLGRISSPSSKAETH